MSDRLKELVDRISSMTSEEAKSIREKIRASAIDRTSARDNTVTVYSGDDSPDITDEEKERHIKHVAESRLDDGPLGFVPILGDVLQGGQVVEDFNKGNYGAAALGAGMLFLPNFIEKPAKYGINALRRYGNLRFFRNLSGLPELGRRGGVNLARENNLLTNVSSDMPFRLHKDYSNMPGGEIIVVDPAAFKGKTPLSIEPSDTFFLGSTVEDIDPGLLHFVSGDETLLRQAESLGMRPSTSQALIDEYAKVQQIADKLAATPPKYSGSIRLDKGYTGWGGVSAGKTKDYRRAMDSHLEQEFGRPTYSEYSLLEQDTGLRAGVSDLDKGAVNPLIGAVEDIHLDGYGGRPESRFVEYPSGRVLNIYDYRKNLPYLQLEDIPYRHVFYDPASDVEFRLMKQLNLLRHPKRTKENEELVKQLLEDLQATPLKRCGGEIRRYDDGGSVETEQDRSIRLSVRVPYTEDAARAYRQRYAESTFRDNQTSSKGAVGPWQIRPVAYNDYLNHGGKKIDLKKEAEARKVRDFTLEQAKVYLRDTWSDDDPEEVRLAKQYAAYNMGATKLRNHLREKRKEGIDINSSMDWIEGLPQETLEYIDWIVYGNDINDGNRKQTKHLDKYKESFEQNIGLTFPENVPAPVDESSWPIVEPYQWRTGGLLKTVPKQQKVTNLFNKINASQHRDKLVEYACGGNIRRKKK